MPLWKRGYLNFPSEKLKYYKQFRHRGEEIRAQVVVAHAMCRSVISRSLSHKADTRH